MLTLELHVEVYMDEGAGLRIACAKHAVGEGISADVQNYGCHVNNEQHTLHSKTWSLLGCGSAIFLQAKISNYLTFLAAFEDWSKKGLHLFFKKKVKDMSTSSI